MFLQYLLYLAIAYVLDILLGDPKWFPHPVRFMGLLIKIFEKLFRAVFPKTPKGEKVAGLFTVIFVISITVSLTWGILFWCESVNYWLYSSVNVYLIYSGLAQMSLHRESKRVYKALKNGDLPLARKYLSMIVGRDTQNLDEEQIIRATVETVAENTSDGVIAPLMFAFLGGAPLMMAYKAINTMDSMLGYKNEKYINFGFFAAKLDDLVNFIPARLCAFAMIFSSGAGFEKFDTNEAAAILKRDHDKHSSPNAGYPEAAVSGILGVQLGGDSYYSGVLCEKPLIGDELRSIEREDIRLAIRLMYNASVRCFMFFSLIAMIVFMIILQLTS